MRAMHSTYIRSTSNWISKDQINSIPDLQTGDIRNILSSRENNSFIKFRWVLVFPLMNLSDLPLTNQEVECAIPLGAAGIRALREMSG